MKNPDSHRLSLRRRMQAFSNSTSILAAVLEDAVRRVGASGFCLRFAPDLTDQAVKQTGLFDWFHQQGLDPLLLQFGGTDGLTQRGEQD